MLQVRAAGHLFVEYDNVSVEVDFPFDVTEQAFRVLSPYCLDETVACCVTVFVW